MNKVICQTLLEFQQFVISNKYDVFICSSSFEERCKVIPSIVQNKIKHVFICHYDNNYQIVLENYNQIERLFKFSTKVAFEKNRPLLNIDNLIGKLGDSTVSLKQNKNILVDITTLTREMIFILIYFFKNVNPINKNNVTFVYNPAIEYSTDKKNISEKWLSKGVKDIRTVLGYSGMFLPDRKLALILLVGFEQERAKKLIDYFEPSVVFLGHASIDGAITPELQEINKKIYEDLKCLLSITIEQFEFSCITPGETKEKIDGLICSLKKEYNIVIASLNNKISSIGVAFSALENPEVQICYPIVNQYNIENYSLSKDEIYIIDIN